MSTAETFRCVGIGELLWDLLPPGKQLGGAPANFACHSHALGADALIISRVGKDALGAEILDRLSSLGLRTDGISIDPAAPTGTVTVALDPQGVPNFTIHENVAWDLLETTPTLLDAARSAHAVCFGSLGQRHPTAHAAIRALLQAAPAEAVRIFDINLRQEFYDAYLIHESLSLANVLKINDDELKILAPLLSLKGSESSQLVELAYRYKLLAVALTKGPEGSVLYIDSTLVSRPAAKVAVADTVGAGDAYTAALALGLLNSHSPERILADAHLLAEYVCTQPGATPPIPETLRAAITRVTV